MRRLGRYALLTRLASGEMSEVFLARMDDRLPGFPSVPIGEAIAVKLVRPELASESGYARLLLAEGPAAIRYAHPSAVKVLDVDRIGGEIYVVTELILGQPLSAVLQRSQSGGGVLDDALILWIAAEVAGALHLAHETAWSATAPGSMVHAGLSPRSVLLSYDGGVRLGGVGSGRARLSVPPTKQRLAYTAPEILLGRSPDRRADLFSLGAVLYDALSGKRLFRRGTDAEIRRAILDEPLPDIERTLARTGDAAALIARLLERSPENRPQSAAEVERVLRKLCAGKSASQALSFHLETTFREDRDAQRRVIESALRRSGLPPAGGLGAAVRGGFAALRGVTRVSSIPPPPASDPPPKREGDAAANTIEEYAAPQIVFGDIPKLTETMQEQSVQGASAGGAVLDGTTNSGDNTLPAGLRMQIARAMSRESKAQIVALDRSEIALELAADPAEAPHWDALREPPEITTGKIAPPPLLDELAAPLHSEETSVPPPMTPSMIDDDSAPLDPESAAIFATVPSVHEAPLAEAEAEALFNVGAAAQVPPLSESSESIAAVEREEAVTQDLPEPTPPMEVKEIVGARQPIDRDGSRASSWPVARAMADAPALDVPAASSPALAAMPTLSAPPPTAPPPVVSSPPPPRAGSGKAERIARYETVEYLGRSEGMTMFRARDPNIGRHVALKVLRPHDGAEIALSPDVRVVLFQREARIAGAVFHPHLPVLLDAGRDKDALFLAYGYIEARPLSTILGNDERLQKDLARSVLRDVADALDHLGEKAISHGDVRASNVLVDEKGRATLIDFSLAGRKGDSEHPLRALSFLVHTPEYLRGEGYGPRSDQFALGMLLYRMLTGVHPFDRSDPVRFRHAVLHDEPRPPEAVRPGVDSRLSEIAMRLLEKDPELRFDRPKAIIELLESPGDRSGPVPVATMARTSQPVEVGEPDRAIPRTTDIIVVDNAIHSAVLEQSLRGRGFAASVVSSLPLAMEKIAHLQIRTLVVSAACATNPRTLRKELERASPGAELRIVPELATRVLGIGLDAEGMASALADLLVRTTALRPAVEGYGAREHLPTIGRAMMRALASSRRDELIVSIALGGRDLAARLRLSISAPEMTDIVPPEVQAIFDAVDRVWTDPIELGGPFQTLPIQVVAIVEAYDRMTRGEDGKRQSPRKALLELRRHADGRRLRPEAVEALVEHLREVMSALDLPPRAPPARRLILVDGAGEGTLGPQLTEAGLVVDRAATPEVALDLLANEFYDAIIAESTLAGDEGLALLKMIRSQPRTRRLPCLLISTLGADTIDDALDVAGATEVVPKTSPPQEVLSALLRLLPH